MDGPVRLALKGHAPGRHRLDATDIRFLDVETDRDVLGTELELIAGFDDILQCRVTFILSGVDLKGIALVNGKERLVHVYTRKDTWDAGSCLCVEDVETGRFIAATRTTFSWKSDAQPTFVIDEDEEYIRLTGPMPEAPGRAE